MIVSKSSRTHAAGCGNGSSVLHDVPELMPDSDLQLCAGKKDCFDSLRSLGDGSTSVENVRRFDVD
jgi:hypothetical protein